MSKLFNYNGTNCDVKVFWYQSDPTNMAIQLTDHDTKEPYAVPTVNLGPMIGNETIMPNDCAFIDTNNMPGFDKVLIERGLAEPYTRWGQPVIGQSGFCQYPLLQFNMDKLKEYDQEGVEKFQDQYWDSFSKARDNIFGKDDFGER